MSNTSVGTYRFYPFFGDPVWPQPSWPQPFVWEPSVGTPPTITVTTATETTVPQETDGEPDDDVKANLRHLCDEAVNVLRDCLLPDTSGGMPYSIVVEIPKENAHRIELAFRILRELGRA